MKLPLRSAAFLASLTSFATAADIAPSPPLSEFASPDPWAELTPAPETTPDRNPRGLSPSEWSGIRAAHTAWEHRVVPAEAGAAVAWQARNPGQQWITHFDGRGFLTTPQAAAWRWGLELTGCGFGENHTTVTGPPEVRTDGGRLTYRWDARLDEWFVNDTRGLEHGFVLRQRPARARPGLPLEVVLTVRGGLRPGLSADAQTVHFRDSAGAPVVNYGGLKVWDADGRVLPSHFSLTTPGTVILSVQEAAARYPLTIDPIAQQAYLKPHNISSYDDFGHSVAVSGDTVVVGAFGESSSTSGVNSTPNDNWAAAGAAYVFVRSGGIWTQQAYLKAHQVNQGDWFGISVAISGDTVVVGAAYEESSTTGVNSTPNENATSGAGAAYVFVRSGTTWTQQAYLKPHQINERDDFGRSVAVSGDTVVVGAFGEDSSTTGINSTPDESLENSGAAYVFVRNGTTWTQQAYLKAHQAGGTDQFGVTVAVSGDTVIVGAPFEDSSTTGINNAPDESMRDAGAAYVFTRSGTVWTQQAYLKAPQINFDDIFGISVAVSGDTAVVGASYEDSSTTGVNTTPNEFRRDSGAAYVFVRSGTVWTQQAYLKAHQVGGSHQFGGSVAVSGDMLVVGAHGESSLTTGINSTPNNNGLYPGAAYVFVRSGAAWTQQAWLKAHQVNNHDYYGTSVAVSGDTVVVGADGEDSGTSAGTPNETRPDAGAAYIYTGFTSGSLTPREQWRQQHFGTTLNTGDAADNFDFDRDGLVNLLEWATGNNPKQPSPWQPTLIPSGPTLEYTFTRSLTALNAGMNYAVEWSDTLAPSSWQTTGVTLTTLTTAGARARYLRLRVTAP